MSALSPSIARSMTGDPVRVLMVDDSVVTRAAIEQILDECTDIELTGKVATANDAFKFLERHRVDIVLLDHEMPSQSGLDALPAMLEAARGAHIVMLSSHCRRGSKTAVSALSLGASDAIAKPTTGQTVREFADALTKRLRRLGFSRRRPSIVPAEVINYRHVPSDFRLRCIAVGASTGGINSLAEFLGGFRQKPGVPILVTQHLPESFIPYYAQQVSRMCSLPVAVAKEGDRFEADRIYIAPGDASLSCRSEGEVVKAVLDSTRDPLTLARPSVNIMFSALAASYGGGVLGAVFTGIGRDGTAGAREIVETGGAIIAQDRESSVVWGMPGSVTRAGLACANLRPGDMFGYIRERWVTGL